MHREPTLIDRVARFFTGRTPGRAKENEQTDKSCSDKIDQADKDRATASKRFRDAREKFNKAVDENATLSESVHIKANKA